MVKETFYKTKTRKKATNQNPKEKHRKKQKRRSNPREKWKKKKKKRTWKKKSKKMPKAEICGREEKSSGEGSKPIEIQQKRGGEKKEERWNLRGKTSSQTNTL